MMLLALNKKTEQKVSISQAEKDSHYNSTTSLVAAPSNIPASLSMV